MVRYGYADAYNLAMPVDVLRDDATRACTADARQPTEHNRRCAAYVARKATCPCVHSTASLLEALESDLLFCATEASAPHH